MVVNATAPLVPQAAQAPLAVVIVIAIIVCSVVLLVVAEKKHLLDGWKRKWHGSEDYHDSDTIMIDSQQSMLVKLIDQTNPAQDLTYFPAELTLGPGDDATGGWAGTFIMDDGFQLPATEDQCMLSFHPNVLATSTIEIKFNKNGWKGLGSAEIAESRKRLSEATQKIQALESELRERNRHPRDQKLRNTESEAADYRSNSREGQPHLHSSDEQMKAEERLKQRFRDTYGNK